MGKEATFTVEEVLEERLAAERTIVAKAGGCRNWLKLWLGPLEEILILVSILNPAIVARTAAMKLKVSRCTVDILRSVFIICLYACLDWRLGPRPCSV